jgi:uncharacterized protein YecE (DUF72 family)
MASDRYPQLDLFGSPPTAQPPPAVAPTVISSDLALLGEQLPSGIQLGTSSWNFAGWRGLVYAERAPVSKLARHGLAAYACHPLLHTVGLDRTYYTPITAADFAAYADAVPDDFRFLVKAHELCTLAVFRAAGRYASRNGERNDLFLHPGYATEHVVEPCRQGLGDKAGPILFQFPPQSVRQLGGPECFAERLSAFLRELPRGPLYAVELRNAELLIPAYVAALTESGAVHCFNVHPSMPPLDVQQCSVSSDAASALVVRWMLHPTQGYDAATVRYKPFDRIIDPDPISRNAIAMLCIEAAASARSAYVIVNNKAEGSSPLSIHHLAAQLVALQQSRNT